jgi:acetyl-CoA synthetase
MLRGIFGDDQRYKETYWSRFDGVYFAGDGAKLDDDGDLWLLGRVDDVMNVSGHRISTTEVEHALVGHPSVAEAAVVGLPDADLGQRIVAFVVASEATPGELIEHVASQLSVHKRPREIRLVDQLPRNAMGKVQKARLLD